MIGQLSRELMGKPGPGQHNRIRQIPAGRGATGNMSGLTLSSYPKLGSIKPDIVVCLQRQKQSRMLRMHYYYFLKSLIQFQKDNTIHFNVFLYLSIYVHLLICL